MISKTVFFFIAVCLLSACATLQTQIDPTLGDWDYVIENLPRGEPEGTFTIAKDADGYTGTLQRNGGDNGVPLEEIALENGVLESSRFQAQGNTVVMSGAFEGESFEGTLSVRGRTFPISAVKK